MALTADLPLDTRGKPIIESHPAEVSPVAEGFKGAENFFTSLGNRNNELNRQTQFNESQTEFGQKQGALAATNETAGLMLSDSLGLYGLTDHPALPSGITQGVPANIQAQIDDANATRSAVTQGRVPPQMAQIKLRNVINTVNTDHPNQAAAVFEVLDKMGWKDPEIEALNTQRELGKSQAVADQALAQKQYEAFTTSEYFNPQTDRATGITIGQGILQKQQNLETDTKNAQLAHTQLENQQMTDAQKAKVQELGDARVGTSLQGFADDKMAQTMTSLSNFVIAAQDNPTALANIEGRAVPVFDSRVDQYTSQMKQHLHNTGVVDQKQYDAVDKWGQAYKDNFKAVFEGGVKGAADAFNTFTNVSGLTMDKSMPLMADIKRMGLGAILAVDLQTKNPTFFTPDMLKTLHAEASQAYTAIQQGDQGSERAALQNYSDLITGKKNIVDFSQETQAAAMDKATKAVPLLTPAINKGDLSGATEFMGSLGALAYGVRTIPPGTTNMVPVVTAARATFTPDITSAAIKLAKTAGPQQEQALQTVQAYRIAASRLLFSVQHTDAGATAGWGAWNMRLDPTGSKFVTYIDTNSPQLKASAAAFPEGGYGPGGAVQQAMARSKPSQDLVDRVEAANRALSVVANPNLAILDPSMHLTGHVMGKDLAAFYTKGTPIPGQQEVAPADTVDQVGQRFLKMLDQPIGSTEIKDTADVAANKSRLVPIAEQVSEANGLDKRAVPALIESENHRWDPNADVRSGPVEQRPPGWEKSHARGLVMAQPGTARGLGQHVEMNPDGTYATDDRLDPQKAIEGAGKQLSGIMKQHFGSGPYTKDQYKRGAALYKGAEHLTTDSSKTFDEYFSA